MSRNATAADGAQISGNDAAAGGPPEELPEAVPDFVGGIHSAVTDFLAGGGDVLGDAIRGVVSDGTVGEATSVVVDVAAAVPF